ncbi:MAG: LysR family transcriptional regulator [Alphaproteobacteria bacterium]|nr:LysR family transcriptional regulator [Alphaproteobacteria bacterium]
MSVQKNILLYKLLAHFAVVARYGQIKRAADELGMRQSNLSSEVCLLEQILNARLCIRQSHGLKMTPTGDQVYKIAKKINDVLSSLPHRFLDNAKSETIRIAVPNMCFTTFQQKFLHQMRKMHPEIVFQVIGLQEMNRHSMDNADVCLTYEYIRSPDVDVLFKIPVRIALITTQQHIADYGIPKSIEDLLCNHHIVINTETAIYDPKYEERRNMAKSLDYVVSNSEMQLSLVQSENLVSMVPFFMIKYMPDIVEFSLPGWDCHFNLYLMTRHGKYRQAAINNICRFIVDIFKSILSAEEMRNLTMNPDCKDAFADFDINTTNM